MSDFEHLKEEDLFMLLIADFSLLSFLGQLHPLLVHLPIGILLAAGILESWNRYYKKGINYKGLVYLGAFSALFSAISGNLLEYTGQYDGILVDQHQAAGILTTLLALLTAFLYYNKGNGLGRLAFGTLLFTCLCTIITGHLGGSLTHGADFLSFKKTDPISIDPQFSSFQGFSANDSLSKEQLDRLNLQVRAIFAHNCYQCHSTAKSKGALALDNEAAILEGGESGPVIVKGASTESELLRRLLLPRRHEDAMPPKGKTLQNEEIQLIKLWIDKGAHWADENLKIFREAELALKRPQLPKAQAGYEHPVDRFVNAYFEKNKQDWPALIDDRAFIRRAYLDILGLLPQPEEIETFLKDKRENKRQVLIEDLLADNDNYAQHWLSFWNDLLRNDYSGTGFITGGRKQITDWLYKSLYHNKPYNQIVAELINPAPEAEGFIKGIKWRGVVNASQRTELQAAQNISQSLLGLNLKCASCHNSFINNLSLDEAYGFANIFAEEPLEIYRCDKPTGRMAKTSFLYPQLGEVVGDSLKTRLEELAGIMVKPENGRLYRTLVNRYWDRLLGRGLVAPVDEMDNIPWSQDLLDWLAVAFISSDYDLKELLSLIMSSKIYQSEAQLYPSNDYLMASHFTFQGPAIRRLSSEQFVDAFSQMLTPMYHGLAYDPSHRKVDGKWIWHPEIEVDRYILPKPGTRYFRKTFSIKKGANLQQARVLITADHAYKLFINDKELSSHADWQEVQKLNLPLDIFKQENIIAIEATNEGQIPNPAGLLFTMELEYEEESERIYSDRSWLSTDSLVEDWKHLSFLDTAWTKVRQMGHFNNATWGALLDFSFEEDTLRMPFARASLVRQDNFMKTLGRPVRENVTTRRDDKITLLQSLMLSNNEFLHEKIKEGAQTLEAFAKEDSKALVQTLYQHLLGRAPNKKEEKLLLKQLGVDPEGRDVEDLIWALILLPEFQLI